MKARGSMCVERRFLNSRCFTLFLEGYGGYDRGGHG